jgi:hypothetical protein
MKRSEFGLSSELLYLLSTAALWQSGSVLSIGAYLSQ